MCCNLQTHTKVIAILCITFAALSIVGEIWGAVILHSEINAIPFLILIAYSGMSLVSAICCLMGSMKQNKCLLIPFMIEKSFNILVCIGAFLGIMLGAGIFLVVIGLVYAALLFLIQLGLSIYFLVMVVKYYQEISSGMVSGYTQGVVFHPNNPTPIHKQGGGLSTVYVPPGNEHVTYA